MWCGFWGIAGNCLYVGGGCPLIFIDFLLGFSVVK
jgi:hypothetical protein